MEVLREAATASSTGSGIHVSILVLMEVLREEAKPPSRRSRRQRVSILVLMEVLREVVSAMAEGTELDEFQSLF